MSYDVKEVRLFDFCGICKVNYILYDCGKDMAEKYNLYHWNNSFFKNVIILFLCIIKNNIYLVSKNGKPIATFQTRIVDETLYFEKLACSPNYSGKGIGSFCVRYIEKLAKKAYCTRVSLMVYEHSQHALEFYRYLGYKEHGVLKTLKYNEIQMEKLFI